MLRNCKVARVLPRIADCAKNDRNAALRARYALYFIERITFRRILSTWDHAPSIVDDLFPTFGCRCCDYALLVLEHWPDEPEIQRSADLYEDMIRRCVSDAVSEV